MSAGLVLASNVSTIVLLPRIGPRPVGLAGLAVAAGATEWLAQLGPQTGYAEGVLGPIVLIGLGLGSVIAPSLNTGTFGVPPQDAGVASATVTVGQQLGASISTSLLNTIFATAVASYLVTHAFAVRAANDLALANVLRHRVLVDGRYRSRRSRRRRPPLPLRAPFPINELVEEVID